MALNLLVTLIESVFPKLFQSITDLSIGTHLKCVVRTTGIG